MSIGTRRRKEGLIPLLALVLLLPLLPEARAGGASRLVDLRKSYTARYAGAAGVGGAGDVDGDGTTDLVIVNGTADPFGRDGAGIVYVTPAPSSKTALPLTGDAFDGWRIVGARASDNLAKACVAGDVNGDGLDDLVLGAQLADTPNGGDSGAAYVLFGSASPSDVDLRDLHDGASDAGFRVDGGGSGALAGREVACIGDVNGDGRMDLAVGAPFAGATYVVFGRAGTEPVDLRMFDLNAQGTAGFRIDTPVPDYSSSYSVGAAGDTNGDGIPDVVVGVVPKIYGSPGSAYVVFGKVDPAPVDVASGNLWGYRIHGAHEGDSTGETVAGAGDVNGDGVADVVVGAHRVYRGLPGKAYVVFGSETAENVELGDLGGRGFVMVGGPNRDAAGTTVGAAGDYDGDGFADVYVGAPFARPFGRPGAGVTYVVRGGTATKKVRLEELGGRGYRIVGARRGDEISTSAAAFADAGSGKLWVLLGGFGGLKTYLVALER